MQINNFLLQLELPFVAVYMYVCNDKRLHQEQPVYCTSYPTKNSKAQVLIHCRNVYIGVKMQTNHLPCLWKHLWTVCLEMFLSKFPISQRQRARTEGIRPLGSQRVPRNYAVLLEVQRAHCLRGTLRRCLRSHGS